MLSYFINRAGKGLSSERRAELEKQRFCFRTGYAAGRELSLMDSESRKVIPDEHPKTHYSQPEAVDKLTGSDGLKDNRSPRRF
jgi:hypothetical protein